MVGLDSGDLLVMGGSSPFVYFRSTAIYRLSSNVETYVAEFQKVVCGYNSASRTEL
jgi:hypothetical protein